MFLYPHIDPVALSLGPLKIRWYGLMYVVGFLAAWGLAQTRTKYRTDWTKDEVSDLIFYAALGVIIGGRVGYMIFYNLPYFLSHPFSVFRVWDGGMSFHGGLLGVAVALIVYGRHIHKTFFELSDFIVPLAPVGLGAGRIGNFINGELWGRVTTVPWGVVYPQAGLLPRHPSQLYEFLLEGAVLFSILWIYSAKPRPRMAVSGLFLICYGAFRILAECFREPDPQYGYLAFNWLTMGQLLSIPMIFAGIVILSLAYQQTNISFEKGSRQRRLRV